MTDAHPRINYSPQPQVIEAAHRLFLFICAYQAEHGYPPTLDEMARATSYVRSALYRHLAYLEAWQYIARDIQRARAITILNRDHIEHPPATIHAGNRPPAPVT